MTQKPVQDSTVIKRSCSYYLLLIPALCLMSGRVPASQPDEVFLSNEYWSVTISPETLQTTAELPGGGQILLSKGSLSPRSVSSLVTNTGSAQWVLEKEKIKVNTRLNKKELSVRFSSNTVGAFTWPVVQKSPKMKALIWPRWEGCYIPLDDSHWVDYLVARGGWDTLEGLSMPFWGLDCGDFSLTYIVTNPYNNEIQFQRASDGLEFRSTHEFTSLVPRKEYGLLIRLGDNKSPVEPARQFRQWLIEQGKFVSMKEKSKKVSNVERLPGAAHVYLWGDGVSNKMLNLFKENGFERMRLCVDGWEGIEKNPDIAEQANRMGYLFGTYDSYHSIHDPSLLGTDGTWPTAQFDRELFETGPIIRRDGKKRGGFKGTGFKLSPIAARPYVEKRVRENMKNVPYSYYFVDCDAYGEVYDDYSPLHRISQAEDAQARVDRMAWISDTFGLVIGSEGGSSFAAGVIHVAEGIIGPVFGWNDPDLRNRDSEYYLGQYYPPDGPKVFVKQVPMKEQYQYFYYDPRFRLPLYETVFHDSVVTTHQWANGSLKYSNVLDTVALTELLYIVPPLYHMNLNEFDKHRDTMKRHYAFFSPLHRKAGFAQMTDFKWLSEDRLLQRTVFDNRTEVIANFSQQQYQHRGTEIPPRSIRVTWTEDGNLKTMNYTPGLKN